MNPFKNVMMDVLLGPIEEARAHAEVDRKRATTKCALCGAEKAADEPSCHLYDCPEGSHR